MTCPRSQVRLTDSLGAGCPPKISTPPRTPPPPLRGSSLEPASPHPGPTPVWKLHGCFSTCRNKDGSLPCLWGLACLLGWGGSQPPTLGASQTPHPALGPRASPGASPPRARCRLPDWRDQQTGALAQRSAGWLLPAPRNPQCTVARFPCQLGSAALLLLSTPPRERERSAF